MSVDLNTCSKCGKICKDKRGLTLHMKACEGILNPSCEFCKKTFANPYSLSIHMSRCSEGKKSIKEKDETIKTELQQLQDKLKEVELKHQKELTDLKTSLRIDLEQQLKIRDNDLSSIMKDYTQLKNDYKVIEVKYEMIEAEKKSLIVDKQTLTELNARLSLKDTTTIINQQTNNDNRVQLNCLEPSMIQGRIHPPDYIVGSVNDLMRMLRSLGVRNSYRVNDKSRGTLSWHKPGEGEVRDPKGDQMAGYIIDALTPDITQEKCYYEEELNRQYQLDDPDLYLINFYKTNVDFCTRLLQKQPDLLHQFRRELIKQGKAKNDNEVDPICEVSYNKFITSISLALFPTMRNWITKSFYDLGRFLGLKIEKHYHTEGASREMMYIVVHSDTNYSHQIYSEKLMDLLREALDSIIETDVMEKIIEDLIEANEKYNTDQVKKMISFLKTPSLEDTREIMRGIVSL